MIEDEELLQEEIGEVNIKSLLQAQIKINENEKFKPKDIEKRKSKTAPREFSAKVKPKKWANPVNLDLKNNLRRDPRFEEYTGELNPISFEKNYSFVENYSQDYIDKLNKVKRNKKYNIEGDKFYLIKKQENLVKGWIKQKQHDKLKKDVQQDIDQENNERIKAGRNPIFLKKKVMKEVISKKIIEKKGENKTELRKYIKKKGHLQTFKNRKDERFSHSLTKE